MGACLSDACSEVGSALPDELRKAGYRFGACGAKSGAEIVPKRDSHLVAGFEQRQECVAAIATGIAAGKTISPLPMPSAL